MFFLQERFGTTVRFSRSFIPFFWVICLHNDPARRFVSNGVILGFSSRWSGLWQGEMCYARGSEKNIKCQFWLFGCESQKSKIRHQKGEEHSEIYPKMPLKNTKNGSKVQQMSCFMRAGSMVSGGDTHTALRRHVDGTTF